MQLGMVHPDRLKSEEIEELWSEADRDGDGVINYKEFQVIPCDCLRQMLNPEFLTRGVIFVKWDPTRTCGP
jgi:hypothetical protein